MPRRVGDDDDWDDDAFDSTDEEEEFDDFPDDSEEATIPWPFLSAADSRGFSAVPVLRTIYHGGRRAFDSKALVDHHRSIGLFVCRVPLGSWLRGLNRLLGIENGGRNGKECKPPWRILSRAAQIETFANAFSKKETAVRAHRKEQTFLAYWKRSLGFPKSSQKTTSLLIISPILIFKVSGGIE